MAIHLKIKTNRETATHFSGVFDDHTLCGLDINGDEHLGIGVPKKVTTKVTCEDCIKIVSFCENIKRTEWK